MKQLVKLPHGGWVNPQHVVSIEAEGETGVLTLSVNDGQFEYPIQFEAVDVDLLARLINGEEILVTPEAAYVQYIQDNLERIGRDGWVPVCFAEFIESEEYQIIKDREVQIDPRKRTHEPAVR